MESKAMMGCGWLGRGEVQGRSLSLEYIPTQWMLARRRRGKEYNVHYDRNEDSLWSMVTQNFEPGWLDVWFARKTRWFYAVMVM